MFITSSLLLSNTCNASYRYRTFVLSPHDNVISHGFPDTRFPVRRASFCRALGEPATRVTTVLRITGEIPHWEDTVQYRQYSKHRLHKFHHHYHVSSNIKWNISAIEASKWNIAWSIAWIYETNIRCRWKYQRCGKCSRIARLKNCFGSTARAKLSRSECTGLSVEFYVFAGQSSHPNDGICVNVGHVRRPMSRWM